MAKALGLGVTAWSPLAGGLLSGKYHGGEAKGRLNDEVSKTFMPDAHRTQKVIEVLKVVSKQVGRSVAQVALAWLRYRGQVVIPIIGKDGSTSGQSGQCAIESVG